MGEMERWQLAWSAPEVYADYLVPAIFGPWVPVVLGSAQLRQGQSVLDVACGTGAVATGAAPRVGATGSVTGVDNNRGMLAVAAARSRHRVRWQEADAQLLPFPDGSFDRVICQLGLQYFPIGPPPCGRCTACCAQAAGRWCWSGVTWITAPATPRWPVRWRCTPGRRRPPSCGPRSCSGMIQHRLCPAQRRWLRRRDGASGARRGQVRLGPGVHPLSVRRVAPGHPGQPARRGALDPHRRRGSRHAWCTRDGRAG